MEETILHSTLLRGLKDLGIRTEPVVLLEHYAELMLEKNKVMNLTAITEPEAVAQLHLLDSAALLRIEEFSGKRVIDVGTGAGLPGIPLYILAEDLTLTLLDSLGKRVDFLRETCEALGLQNVDCVHARAEEYAQQHRESYDIAVSRAVAALPVLCELCLPLIKTGGRFLAMKSVESNAELSSSAHAIRTLGGRVDRVVDYTIPTSEIRHRVIVIEKTAPTPAAYPRPFAKIKKNPL